MKIVLKMAIVLYALLSIVLLNGVRAEIDIKIGALFNSDTEELTKWSMQAMINKINAEISERREDNPYTLTLLTENIIRGDNFAASQAVCNLLEKDVVTLFGPVGETTYHIQSICNAMDIPHMVTKPDTTQDGRDSVINLYPHHTVMAEILVDLVNLFEWKVFTVLYENNEYLPRLSELLKMHDGGEHIISMRQIDTGIGKNYRAVFQDVKKSGDTKFIIDCSTDILYDVLIQAQQVGLMSDDHSYIITNFDLHTIDFEPFKYGGSNFTGMRMIDPEDPFIIQSIENLISYGEKLEDDDKDIELTPNTLRTDTALLLDALNLFAMALDSLDIVENFEDETLPKCDDENTWEHGLSMVNQMRISSERGFTGYIKFDHESFRTDFQIQIIEMNPEGIHKIGLWNTTQGLNVTRANLLKETPALAGSLSNMSFIVITAISPPYGMRKDSISTLVGNDRYEGFGIELIEEISKMLGFNYTFVLEPNAVYGKIDPKTKQWDGMIRELLDNRADLAITDLTITAERQKAVDFTNPFMNLGISILYKAPTKEPPKLFSFMSPFSSEVWLFLGSAYMGVSILLFVVARIAPKEWQNPYPCVEDPDNLMNQFSMANSLWFTVGSVLQQGSELAPIAISTRMIAGIWWFFTLIMVSSYTANLAAFLTVESNFSPISNAQDLADNEVGIMYGCKKGGSTLGFFNDSSNPVYKKMAEYMTKHPEALTSSNPEGLERIQTTNYAYIMESTSIEYITERNCDVAQVGGLLDNKGYGIAMRKNMSYHDALTKAVLILQEQGVLHKMKDKWWKEKCGGGKCSGVDTDSGGSVALTLANVGGVFIVLLGGCIASIFITASEMLYDVWTTARTEKAGSGGSDSMELGLLNVGGVFVVLLAGCILATITAIWEMMISVAKKSNKHKVPFRKELIEELKFVGKCSGDTKPVRHRHVSNSPDSSSEGSISEKSKESKKSKSNEIGFKVKGFDKEKS